MGCSWCQDGWGPPGCPVHDPERHEFEEEGNDTSMCICGVPALTHDEVYP